MTLTKQDTKTWEIELHRPFRRQSRCSTRSKASLTILIVLAALTVTFEGSPAGAAVPAAGWETLASDSFSRSDADGWGSAESGGTYTLTSSAASGPASVTSGRGRHAEVAPGSAADSFLASSQARDVRVRETLIVPTAGDASVNLYHGLWARRLADGSGYRGRLHIGPAGQLSISVERVKNHSGTLLDDVSLAARASAADEIVVMLEVVQDNPVRISAKAWKVGTSEPAWQVTYTDTSTARIDSAGAVGSWDYVSRSANAATVEVDDFEALTQDNAVDVGTPQPAQPTASGFSHPGVLVGTRQLDFVRTQLAAGAEPWKSQLQGLERSQTSLGTQPGTKFASLAYVAHPVAVVDCGPGPASSAPKSCVDEKNDAIAAYADALMWSYTRNGAYAQKAIQILNAWSATLRQHTGSNAPLQASWAGSVFPRAAELVRYTYTPSVGQARLDVQRMVDMLRTAYLPVVNTTISFGGANWLMSMTEATLNIAVFTDDRNVFNQALTRWRTQVPSAIYMATDRPTGFSNISAGSPIPPPGIAWVNPTTSIDRLNAYWYNPTRYVSGLEGETCRDVAHAAMGLGAMVNVAETARLQGVDLYSEQKQRIFAGVEANTGWLVSSLTNTGLTNWVCRSAPNPTSNQTWKVTYEVAFNAFSHRLGMSMPNTGRLLSEFTRSTGYKADFGFAFEALTNAGTP